ncbi:MAG: LruC domain-containing protein [Bacteroidales bacterium]|nr:LruC domain-containing protein [Bacteroidales bacterium]MCF8344707.1 LruC domain-containing protein [Bacteroidales bacterium]MCF8349782.1 LruC domain-containing protein [Bacteroidales bacterium]MCF8376301.1 LruC domain-containing protein [Bacteroidales bacterium]MCF8400995.1 LruC domain-containing protein [Bacteroidales bacterium]
MPLSFNREQCLLSHSRESSLAIEFIAPDFKVVKEKTDILLAYPQFNDWAESRGNVNQNWYDNPDNSHTYTPSWQYNN